MRFDIGASPSAWPCPVREGEGWNHDLDLRALKISVNYRF